MVNERTTYTGNWIHSFPEHFQWSNAALVTKGMAPWGAVAMGEIDEVVQRPVSYTHLTLPTIYSV